MKLAWNWSKRVASFTSVGGTRNFEIMHSMVSVGNPVDPSY